MNIKLTAVIAVLAGCLLWGFSRVMFAATALVEPAPNSRIVIMGNGLGSRMSDYGHFETGLHLRYPEHDLFIRNIARDGNTPSFRPHAGRPNQLGFPGAEAFHHPYTGGVTADGAGHRETEEEWLALLKPDILIAFFGFNESFQGDAGLESFSGELDAFVKHTVAQPFNGVKPPELILVSPTAYQDLTWLMDVPDGRAENDRLAAYTEVMRRVAEQNGVRFIDAFAASADWFADASERLTTDGARLNNAGYRRFSEFLIEEIFGPVPGVAAEHRARVHAAVMERNWLWTMDYKIPNGVHVFGQRYDPFGPANYPHEIQKIREMTMIRDQAVWAAARGQSLDVAALDARTVPLPDVVSNFNAALMRDGALDILSGEESLRTMTVPEGYRVELFASEREFPELKNPAQMTFDNQGRLWVATLPSYPHWRAGDPFPDDKLLVFEDTSGDGRADRMTVWADSLHLPIGFALAPEGVYVTQGIHLVLLGDSDGDGRADTREIVLSGFDDHDTHHGISAYATDPSGAIFMGEGTFLHTNVETAYGPVRGTNGGFYRFDPQRRQLERHVQVDIPNPWGIAFDDWGQHFFIHTSGPPLEWMLPSSIRPRYGIHSPPGRNLIQREYEVRPTAGLEIVSSRHFPEEVQGDILLGNNIGFLGIRQHELMDDGTGYAARFRHDLLEAADGNFRPVDLEFAPDGSLYLIDWHNPLIGHMQHNARDPNRDHSHGRIFRITYPARPLVDPPTIAGASITQLLDNLKLHELRARERSRRELRGRDPDEVLRALNTWTAGLDRTDPLHEHHLLEALWVTWGLNRVDAQLLRRVFESPDFRARAAAVRVIRYSGHRLPDQVELLKRAAGDPHGRVRAEAVVAASWLPSEEGLAVLAVLAPEHAADSWIAGAFQRVAANLAGEAIPPERERVTVPEYLAETAPREAYLLGAEVYQRDGSCGTCHQPDGAGLPNAGFPPLAGTAWVTGSEDRLIRIVLRGLAGPMEVAGRQYSGMMPGFAGILSDAEVAGVLTYIRNSFGNRAAPIDPARVARMREEVGGGTGAGGTGAYSAAELLRTYPLE